MKKIQPLFDLGAKVNETNDDGHTPMDLFISKQFSSMMIIALIENGAILTKENIEKIQNSGKVNKFKEDINTRIKEMKQQMPNILKILKKRTIGIASKKELKLYNLIATKILLSLIKLELSSGFEPLTSSLPWMRFTN